MGDALRMVDTCRVINRDGVRGYQRLGIVRSVSGIQAPPFHEGHDLIRARAGHRNG